MAGDRVGMISSSGERLTTPSVDDRAPSLHPSAFTNGQSISCLHEAPAPMK